MISLDQINGEISVLEEEKPTHLSMQKLAALYTVRDHIIMGSQPQIPVVEVAPSLGSESEFAKRISGKNLKDVLSVVDELVETIRLLDSGLYNTFIRRIP